MAIAQKQNTLTVVESCCTKLHGARMAQLSLAWIAALSFSCASAAAERNDQPTAADIIDNRASEGLPLNGARRMVFTTTEGTWMSPDVSPDGQTLVFDLLGDLYTLPIGGGAARRLLSGLAFDSQPRWSPDGRRIAFLSDRNGNENVWICDADGTHLQQVSRATAGVFASPVWTPDGLSIIVSRQADAVWGNFQLWSYAIGDGTGTNLSKSDSGRYATGSGWAGAAMDALGAAFGADPRYLWFARHRGGVGQNRTFPQWQLATFDLQTGEIVVQSDNRGSAMRPVLSRDGQWLVYATRHEAETGLRLRELSSGAERWLAWPVQRDDQEAGSTRDLMPSAAFLPDGSALVTSYAGKLWRISVPDGRAIEIPFRAEIDQVLGPAVKFANRIETGEVLVRQLRDPALSPDGKRVAFSALNRLYVMDWQPRARPVRLAPHSEDAAQAPAWSPDGRWLAYVTWDDSEGGAIWRIRADGRGRPERLTTRPGFFDSLAWSPDGSRIVVLRAPLDLRLRGESAAAGLELAWLPAAGGALTHIAYLNPLSFGSGAGRAGVPRGRPHFTRDGGRVYFFMPGEGLISMRFDGGDRRVHLNVTGYRPPDSDSLPAHASEILVSPDGKQAAVQINHQIWLTALPLPGAQTPTVDLSQPMTAGTAKRLSRLGGEFMSWSHDGNFVQWALGHSLFRYAPLRGSGRTAEREAYEGERLDVRLQVPRDTPRGTLLLRGARLITMRGDEVIERGDIVVRDNRIVTVGPAGSGAAPTGARVVDVSGKTIIPGLVDLHAHLWPAWRIHQSHQFWKYLAALAYGVTTTRDPEPFATDIFTYADRVETGELLGPRIYSTGPGIQDEENIQSLDDARVVLRRYREFYDTRTIKQYVVGNRQQRQWVIMAAQELGLMPTIEGGFDFKMNLTVLLDGYSGQEHSYPITPLYRDVVELAARSGLTYTPTLLVSYGGPHAENYFYERVDVHEHPKLRRFYPHEAIDQRAERRPWFRENQYVFDRLASAAAQIVRAGGRVGVGSHSQAPGIDLHWEMQALARGGLTPHEVLRAATLHGAEAISFGQDIGSLEPGKLADLIVLDQNPLEDIRHTEGIRYVLKNGRLYEGETLNEVYPRKRELPRLHASDDRPEDARRF